MSGYPSNLAKKFSQTEQFPQHIFPLLPLYNAKWWGNESLTSIVLVWSQISKLLHRNDHHIETTCRAQHLGRYFEGQGHSATLQQSHVRPLTLLLWKHFFRGVFNYVEFVGKTIHEFKYPQYKIPLVRLSNFLVNNVNIWYEPCVLQFCNNN